MRGVPDRERRTARGGKDSIDHPRGAHDDVANAVAGAIMLAGARSQPLVISADVLARARHVRPPLVIPPSRGVSRAL